MRMFILSVRDVRANVFFNPFTVDSIGRAERQFEDEINRKSDDNPMFLHPRDFELYHIGYFSTDSGLVEHCSHTQIRAGGACVRAVPGDSRQLPLEAVN